MEQNNVCDKEMIVLSKSLVDYWQLMEYLCWYSILKQSMM